MAAIFTPFGRGLLVLLTRGFMEYGKQIVQLILCAKQKNFVWGWRYYVQIITRHTNRDIKKTRMLLPQITRMLSLVNHRHRLDEATVHCTTDYIVSIYQNKVHLTYHISEERTFGPRLHCFSLSAGDLCSCHTVLVIPRIKSCVLFTSYYSYLSYNFPT